MLEPAETPINETALEWLLLALEIHRLAWHESEAPVTGWMGDTIARAIASDPATVAAQVGSRHKPHQLRQAIELVDKGSADFCYPLLLLEALEHSYRVHGVPEVADGRI